MTDATIIQLSTPILAFASTCFLGWMGYLIKKLDSNQEKRAKAAAAQVEGVRQSAIDASHDAREVKTTLAVTTSNVDTKLNDLQKVAGGLQKVALSTHTFINSERGEQLRDRARDKWEIYELTKTPEKRAIAEEADRQYAAHQAAQRAVDAQPGTDAEKKGHAPESPPIRVFVENSSENPVPVKQDLPPP